MAESGLVDIQHINLVLMAIVMLIQAILSINLFYKAHKNKEINIALIGINITFSLVFAFMPSLNYFFTLVQGYDILPEWDFLITIIFSSISNIAWLIVFTNLIYNSKQKKILGIYLAYSTCFIIVASSLLFSGQKHLVGNGYAPPDFDLDVTPMLVLPIILYMSLSLVTGVIFVLNARRADDPVVKLKGTTYLIYLVFVNLAIGFDMSNHMMALLFLSKILLVVAIMGMYFTFALPSALKNYVIRKAAN